MTTSAMPAPANEPAFIARQVTKVYTMGEVEVRALRGVNLELWPFPARKEQAMSFRQRWIGLLSAAARASARTRALLTPVGVIVFGAFTGFFVLAALWVDEWLQLPGLLPPGVRLVVSVALLAVGGALTAWSVFHFLRVRGTPVPFNPPPDLVRTGPYRHVRHPMVTGVFVLLFGIGFAVDSLSLVCFFTPVYVLLNVWELKMIEEPELAERLGDVYLEYRRRTPMFVPRPALVRRTRS